MPSSVYHYTSLQGLLGIIQPKKLEFHGSRYDSLNDPLDCTFAKQIVLPKILAELEKDKKLSEKEKEYVELFPYIVCFSENYDDENMWKHYGSQICLELDNNIIKTFYEYPFHNDFIHYNKCVYCNEDELDKTFLSKCEHLNFDFDNIPVTAQIAMGFIKRDAFKRENEWRIICFDAMGFTSSNDEKDYCSFTDCEIPNDVFSYIRGKDIVLYKKICLPQKALKGIIINETDPTHYIITKNHINLILTQNIYPIEKIYVRQSKRYPL